MKTYKGKPYTNEFIQTYLKDCIGQRIMVIKDDKEIPGILRGARSTVAVVEIEGSRHYMPYHNHDFRPLQWTKKRHLPLLQEEDASTNVGTL